MVHKKQDFYKFQNPIREELIDRVKLQIDRHSVKDKLRDLLEWMAVIKRDTNHHVRLLYLLSTQLE